MSTQRITGIKYAHVGRVDGRGRFPIDMLRHDACHPRNESDSHIIEATHQHQGPDPWTVFVVKYSDRSHARDAWTPRRWESFVVKFTEADDGSGSE